MMIEDVKLIKWVLKEILGYKHNLCTYEELQLNLLTAADQTSNTAEGNEIKNIILNIENKLEEIKYTASQNKVQDESIKMLNTQEEKLRYLLS